MKRKMKLWIYKDKGSKWWWGVVGSNGKKTAVSGEHFASKWNAQRAAGAVWELQILAGALIWANPSGKIPKKYELCYGTYVLDIRKNKCEWKRVVY